MPQHNESDRLPQGLGGFLDKNELSRRRLLHLGGRTLLWYAGLRMAGELNSLGADWMYGSRGTAETKDYIAPQQAPGAKRAGWC